MSETQIEITARWESHDTHVVPEGVDAEALADRINGGDLDAVIEAGDVDTVGAELVDYSARVVG